MSRLYTPSARRRRDPSSRVIDDRTFCPSFEQTSRGTTRDGADARCRAAAFGTCPLVSSVSSALPCGERKTNKTSSMRLHTRPRLASLIACPYARPTKTGVAQPPINSTQRQCLTVRARRPSCAAQPSSAHLNPLAYAIAFVTWSTPGSCPAPRPWPGPWPSAVVGGSDLEQYCDTVRPL